MKAIRTYRMEDNRFFQDTIFLPEDDSLDDPMECSCQAHVLPSPQDDSLVGYGIGLFVKDSEFPLDLRLQEMQHFINILKTMYYGS